MKRKGNQSFYLLRNTIVYLTLGAPASITLVVGCRPPPQLRASRSRGPRPSFLFLSFSFQLSIRRRRRNSPTKAAVVGTYVLPSPVSLSPL